MGSKYNNIKSSVQRQHPDKTIEGFTFSLSGDATVEVPWDLRTISREQYQAGGQRRPALAVKITTAALGSCRAAFCLSVCSSLFDSFSLSCVEILLARTARMVEG